MCVVRIDEHEEKGDVAWAAENRVKSRSAKKFSEFGSRNGSEAERLVVEQLMRGRSTDWQRAKRAARRLDGSLAFEEMSGGSWIRPTTSRAVGSSIP